MPRQINRLSARTVQTIARKGRHDAFKVNFAHVLQHDGTVGLSVIDLLDHSRGLGIFDTSFTSFA